MYLHLSLNFFNTIDVEKKNKISFFLIFKRYWGELMEVMKK